MGTKSNKAAIGAKVRVKAKIGGKAVWQLREISAQNGYCSQNDIRAHFGLKDAALIDSILIEWPSGLKEYYLNVPAKKFLTYQEGDAKVSIVPLKENLNEIHLFPNPARHEILLQRESGTFGVNDHITLLDLSGRVVQEWSATNVSLLHLRLDTMQTHVGPFLLNITTGAATISKKVMLE